MFSTTINKNNIIEQCKQRYCQIKPSKIVKGQVGIFVIRSIPKNTVVFTPLEI
jgi:hypothetical protein